MEGENYIHSLQVTIKKKKTNENQQSQKTSFRLGTNTKEMFKIDPGWKTSSPRDCLCFLIVLENIQIVE